MRTQTLRSIRTITFVVFALTIFFFAFFQNSKNIPWLAAVNPFADDPYDAVGSFAIQLTFLASLLSIIRAFRPYATKEIPSAQLLLILRGETVALLSIIVSLIADAIAMLRYPSMWRHSPAGWILVGLVSSLTLLTTLAGLLLYRIAMDLAFSLADRSWLRAVLFPVSLFILTVYPVDLLESIPGGIFTAVVGMIVLFIATWSSATVLLPPAKMEFEDIFDDIASMYKSVKSRVSFVSYLEKLRNVNRLRNIFDRINPRKHKWNFIVLIAFFMGGSFLLVEALKEGISTSMGIVMLVWVIFLGIEGAGVVLGYLLFGKFLGLFREQ